MHGPSDLDGAADPSGFDAQVVRFCSRSMGNNVLETDLSGRKIYCNPPFRQARRFLEHYLEEKARDPEHTSALCVLPLDREAK